MMGHAWEIVGCVAIFGLVAAALVAFGRWLDDQGEQEWLEGDE